MTVLAEVADPDGRRVVLTHERWEHIVRPPGAAGHPEMEPFQADVMLCVERPDRRLPGRRPKEEWLYLDRAGPSRWLKVVVGYEGDEGRIITAFARRSFP